jgi:Zinc carboxypeptidase
MARLRRLLLLVVAVVALGPVSSASAAEPPWCGTPEPDFSADVLADGTDPADPAGSFPHIPHYAIGCTLEDIEDRSRGRMDVRVIGQSSLGRDMYGVVINRTRTWQERRAFRNWLKIRRVAVDSPAYAQKLLRRMGDDVKVPILVQGSIHGDEFEGVDSDMEVIEKYATTPYGTDPEVDEILSNAILVFNVIQNPDGRVFGVRQNANGFDLNRDYLTQSQPETPNSIRWMQRWLAPEMLDLHGYTEPTLIEATTKPHNPSIEYDMWLKWNQPRIDANEAALDAIGQDVQRPINDWCPEADPNLDRSCDNGVTPGPHVAEGWDDWGPFYAPMYHQHIGLDSSTVETCNEVTPPAGAWWRPCGGRVGARDIHTVVQESTFEFVVANRDEMLGDMLTVYRRNDEDAPRPACCPPPFDPEFHNWMLDYPQAYVIPVGSGQRSDAEANRLVEWLLFNEIEVHELERDYRFGSQTFEKGSYVVRMAQTRRGLADTALSLGVDISDRIQRLYAPPAAWSHGYLWGADTVTIADGARFSPKLDEIHKPNRLKGSVPRHKTRGFTLRIDSPTAVRALNDLVRGGAHASLATTAFSGGPAGTVVFGADRGTRRALKHAAKEHGLDFGKLRSGSLPQLEAIERVPRFRVFSALGNPPTGSTQPFPRVDQSVWVLRELGFEADPVNTAALNTSPTDPLAGYDLIFNAASGYPADTPANQTARNRLAAFFARGGGYIGGQFAGATFLSTGGQVTGLTAAFNSGVTNPNGTQQSNGYSGILLWDNTGGASSVITGNYPARDTLIADPPTWLTAVPATMSVDARMPASGFFAAGLWPNNGATTAPGSAVIAHGTNTANTARLVVFANNPLYRADPEREWPTVGSAAYWADN